MPINEMIALQGQVGNPLNALAQGYKLGEFISDRPVRADLNTIKVDQGRANVGRTKAQTDLIKTQREKLAKDSNFRAAAMGAMELSSTPFEQWGGVLQRRMAEGQRYGYNADAEREALEMLQTDPEGLKGQVAGLARFGQQLFGKTQASRSVALNPGGQLYSQDGTLLAQNNNAKPGAAPQAAGTGPQGKSVDAWAYNVLLNGDPSGKEFAAAKAHLSRSRTQLVQTENGLMPVAQPPVDLGWAVDGSNGQGAIPPPNPVGAPAPSQSPSHGGQVPPTGNVIPGTGKPATEDQSKAGGWLRQATNAYKNMTDAIRQDQGAASPTIAEKIAGKVGTEAVNAVASPQRQRYINAASEFSEAVLRAATGAGVTIDEAKQKIEALTPGYFDSPELVAQKQQAMQMYLDSLRVRAGSTAKDVENPIENTDPLGLFK